MRTRSALLVLALLIALPVWAATQTAEVETPEVAPADVEMALEQEAPPQDVPVDPSVEAFLDELSQQGDPVYHCPCSDLAGKPCTSGSWYRCWLANGEPGICVCVEGFYSCG